MVLMEIFYGIFLTSIPIKFPNTDVAFYAGNRVRLNTGFGVKTGAKFKAGVSGCQN